MATIINNPGSTREVREVRDDDSGTGAGLLLGILIIVVLAVLFVLFGLPYLRQSAAPTTGGTNINVELPQQSAPATGGDNGGVLPTSGSGTAEPQPTIVP